MRISVKKCRARARRAWKDISRKFRRFWNGHLRVIAPIMLVAVIAVAALTLAAALSFAQARKHMDRMRDYGRDKFFTVYEVKYGDTLWDIASDVAGSNPEYPSTGVCLEEIKRMNNIKNGSRIIAGSKLILPYFSYADDQGNPADRYAASPLQASER